MMIEQKVDHLLAMVDFNPPKDFVDAHELIRARLINSYTQFFSEIKKRCMEEIQKLINQDSNEAVSDVRRLEGIIEGYEAAKQAIENMEIE